MKKYLYLLLISVFAYSAFAQGEWRNFYEELPSLENCKSGKINNAEQVKMVNELNAIRALHGLQPVQYKPEGFQNAMDAALICVANARLTHTPESTSQCYSQSGYDGCSTSNLHLSTHSTEYVFPSNNAIAGWLIDSRSLSSVASAGHRRSILNPFVNGVAFGRVDGNPKVAGKTDKFCISLSMKYNYYSSTAVGLVNDFVAYPYHNYPIRLVDKKFYLSFMAVVDKKNLWNNLDVDFSKATITMKTENGVVVNVFDKQFDNEGWGSFPNAIHWKAENLKDNEKYLVEIKNVKYNNEVKEYSYWFKLTNDPLPDPDSPDILASPILTNPEYKAKEVELNVDFAWKKVEEAEKYEFLLSENEDFSTVKETKTINTNSITINNLSKNQTYYWKVRALKDDLKSEYSKVFSFTTVKSTTPPPAKFATLSPKDNETNVDLFPKLIWSKKEGAYYDLQVNTSDQFSNESFLLVNEKNYKDTSYQIVKELYKKGTYYWRVRYKLPTLSGDWTPVSKFVSGNVTSVEDIYLNLAIVPEINITPNPVKSDVLNISFNSWINSEYYISIYNVLGKVYLKDYKISAIEGINNSSISLNLNNGAYFIVISDKNKNTNSKRFNVNKD